MAKMIYNQDFHLVKNDFLQLSDISQSLLQLIIKPTNKTPNPQFHKQ
jgi:hypothetical protein